MTYKNVLPLWFNVFFFFWLKAIKTLEYNLQIVFKEIEFSSTFTEI